MKLPIVVFCLLFPVFVKAEELFVQVQRSAVRAAPSSWAKVVATVGYGDRLSVKGQEGGFFAVTTKGGVRGFLHESALTEREIVLTRTSKTVTQTIERDDVVLAGKGFNPEVEKSFAANRGSQADFGGVNRAERMRADEAELRAFVRQGGLK